MKKYIKLTCFVLLFSILTSHAYATSSSMGDTPLGTTDDLLMLDESMTGTITINLEEAGKYTSVEDVEFSLYKIADVVDGQYDLVDTVKETELDLNTMETSTEIDDAAYLLAEYLETNQVEADEINITDSNGVCEFDDLEVGVYLMTATSSTNYDNITPFIIAVPTFSNEIYQMLYDISVYPKHSPKLTYIQILKVDAADETNVLKRAGFTLYDEEMNILQEAESNKDGIATFEGIPFGDYYLKETSAPKGYKISDEIIAVKIDGEYSADKLYTIKFPNELLPSLSTGDNAPIIVYACIGVISLLCLLGLMMHRKKNISNPT